MNFFFFLTTNSYIGLTHSFLFFRDKDLQIRKVCVWGWSYGGFLTAKTLQTDLEGVVDCGVSVAPVTDWRWYDSAYTERYACVFVCMCVCVSVYVCMCVCVVYVYVHVYVIHTISFKPFRYMQVPSTNPDGYNDSSVVMSSLEVFERKSPNQQQRKHQYHTQLHVGSWVRRR